MSKPLAGIIMGSDSDLAVMQEAGKIFEEFGVDYEITVISAHRTPEKHSEYTKSAIDRGLKVIIAGAGGSAHLAGVTAALTTLPIIGVPIKAKSLDGLDSLFSTVQMPPGVPVATVGVNAAKNAGLLAVQILATADKDLGLKLLQYKDKIRDEVLVKGERLEKLGAKKYLEEM